MYVFGRVGKETGMVNVKLSTSFYSWQILVLKGVR